MAAKASRARRGGNGSNPTQNEGKRELIVIARPEAGLRATRRGVYTSAGAPEVAPLAEVLDRQGVALQPLFGTSEDRIRVLAERLPRLSAATAPDMGLFYHVDADDARLDEIQHSLIGQDAIEACYVKPAASTPMVSETPAPRGRKAGRARTSRAEANDVESINAMTPQIGEPPAQTPDFTANQIYLDPAPAGIDARHAWTLSGGRGDGVRVIDLEWGWRFGHEDLLQNQLGILDGVGSSQDNHGTAVLGEISGDANGYGVEGISPNAQVGAVAFSMPSATAIRKAADRLGQGDIILLEIHRPGPNATGVGQQGYIAIEWWPDDFAAIQYAVNKGIIVVEAAGNGGQNFDDAIYDQPMTGFPSNWTNPLNPANPSSGAVVVGAGAPPPGTHGRNHGPDRSRLGFSNHGARVDAQGWGREVTTTGYGDLQGGSNRDEWYTDTFSGTSSASPIVVGALACVQGVRRARNEALLTSPQAIALLRGSGSPQQDAPARPATQRIGNRPDLRQLIPPATAQPWLYHRTVDQTFGSGDTQNAWAHVVGLGWRRVEPTSPDGVTNLMIGLSAAAANGRTVHLRLDNDRITQMFLL